MEQPPFDPSGFDDAPPPRTEPTGELVPPPRKPPTAIDAAASGPDPQPTWPTALPRAIIDGVDRVLDVLDSLADTVRDAVRRAAG